MSNDSKKSLSSLTAELVSDLSPVDVLSLPRFNALLGGAALVSIVAGCVYYGMRPNIVEAMSWLHFLAETGLLFLGCLLSGYFGLTSLIPGLRVEKARGWVLGVSLLWLLALVGRLLLSESFLGYGFDPGVSWICVQIVTSIAVIPMIISSILVRKLSFLTRPFLTWIYLAGFVGLVGGLGIQFICPADSPAHILVWHGLPIVGGVGIFWVIIRKLSVR